MKRKLSACSLMAILLAGALCLSGCSGGEENGDTTGSDNNGHYENNDGTFGDGSENENSSDGSEGFNGSEGSGNTSGGSEESGSGSVESGETAPDSSDGLSEDKDGSTSGGAEGRSAGRSGNSGVGGNGGRVAGGSNGGIGGSGSGNNGSGIMGGDSGAYGEGNGIVAGGGIDGVGGMRSENFTPSNQAGAMECMEEGLAAAALKTTKVCWGMGRERDSDNRPLDAVKAQQKYGETGAAFLDMTEEKAVYLTFDEGYENGYTGRILDTLKERGVTATFFVTYDYCKNSPDLVQRMIDEGHTLGNHSYTHPSLPDCSAKEAEEEILFLHDYVKENFGYEMKLFRFPKGEFSEKTLAIAKQLGYTSVFWSFAYLDWDTEEQPEVKEAFDTITSATHKGEICLLHAVSKANADCLGDVIDYWKNNGYSIESGEKLIKG